MITTQEIPTGTASAEAPELRIWNGQETATYESASAASGPSAAVIWTLRLLCVTALAVSGYLAYAGLTGSKIAGCGGGLWDCNHVTSTRWGKWFGIPVGLAACGMYAVCCGSLCFTGARNDQLRSVVWKILTVAGLAAGLAAVWFISLQVIVIGHLCKWCLVAHTCGLIVCGLILWHRPAASTTRLAMLSVLGVSVLVGGQLAYKPPTFEIEEFPDPGPGQEGAAGLLPPGVDDPAGELDVLAPPVPGMEDGVLEPPAPPPEEFAPPIIEEGSEN